MQTKVCTRCRKEKEIIYFSKEKFGRFGVASICKDCRKIEARNYNQLHFDEQKLKREIIIIIKQKICKNLIALKIFFCFHFVFGFALIFFLNTI